jgi:divalent metal cation (Fe/Co/Zn/Cd) transporter
MTEQTVLRRQRILASVVMATSLLVVGGAVVVRHMASDARNEFLRTGASVAQADSLLSRIDDVARVVSMIGLAGGCALLLAAVSLLVARRSEGGLG